MVEAKTPLLEVDLGEENGSKQFFDRGSLKQWYAEEKLQWDWLGPLGGLRVQNQVISRFNAGINLITQMPDDAPPAAVNEVRQHLINMFASFGIPLSGSPRGVFRPLTKGTGGSSPRRDAQGEKSGSKKTAHRPISGATPS